MLSKGESLVKKGESDSSFSKFRQLPRLEASTPACFNKRLKIRENWRAVGLLFHPQLLRTQLKNSSRWSWESLYDKTYFKLDEVKRSLAKFFRLVKQKMKDKKPVDFREWIMESPSMVLRLSRNSTQSETKFSKWSMVSRERAVL